MDGGGVGWLCGDPVFDIENNEYGTVQIGGQCWMQQNMRTTTYPDETAITDGSSIWGGGVDNGYYSCPGNATNIIDCNLANPNGMLYQWSAAMNGSTANGAQGICPSGWHVATDNEWKTLEMQLGMSQADADLLSVSIWRGASQGVGTKLKQGGASGFNDLLPGYWNTNTLIGLGAGSILWTGSDYNANGAWRRYLSSSSAGVLRHYSDTGNKSYGASVRCLKN